MIRAPQPKRVKEDKKKVKVLPKPKKKWFKFK